MRVNTDLETVVEASEGEGVCLLLGLYLLQLLGTYLFLLMTENIIYI
jgi:hypothetical protein